MTTPIAQPPPGQAFDRQAELAVVGGILLDNDALLEARLVVEASDFYDSTIQTIFKACCELSEAGSGIDLVTLSNQLKKHSGANWVTALIDCTAPTSAHTKNYAQIVKRYSLARTAHNTAQDINKGISQVIAEGADLSAAQELLANAGRVIMEAENSLRQTGPRKLDIIVGDTIRNMSDACETPDGVTGVATPLQTLNKLTGGLHAGQLTLIGARPRIGKSALALDMALYAATRGVPVLFQSLEMSEQDLGLRAVCQSARVNILAARLGHIHKDEWPPLWTANNKLCDLPLYIDDTARLTFAEIRAQAYLYKRQFDIGVMFVDYLQLIYGSEAAQARSREQEIAEISRGMKDLSKELSIPIVCLVQLNRKVDEQPEGKPLLSNLRESGSLEQDADNVLFLYRQEKKDQDWQGDMGLILAKQRNGPEGELDLTFEREYTTFKERTRDWSNF